MRITHRAVTHTALLGLNGNLAAVGRLQQQLTSGKVISAPSDSPTGTNTAMRARRDQSAALQHARNISDGQSRLDATDSALSAIVGQVQQVRAKTVQGLNTGSMSATSRQAIGVEVGELRESLLGLANSTIDGRPLFGGPTTEGTAYDPATGGYVGVGGAGGTPVVPILRRVSDSEQIRVDVTGPEAFGPPGSDLFTVVSDIADHVVTDPDALSSDLAALDVALARLLDAASAIGARSARMEAAAQVNTDLQLTLKTQLAGVEDVDLAKTIMELSQQQVGYQAALQATANVIQPTLVDFLR
ncbi:flagellar hook protein [Geodermatophilus sp. TF02-6]|uniref:flagellin N-terminal helical domain-containing protein n=1 Tax=Geodermatophilus sp. TF02-6 TaxID=2250575 RepID=UPI000DE90546|nr:flagellin [Geodermatophilus sp. TF02-6]RBY79610.1 flagellar hook protein [Geodermatophilus sp. TF02-6]